jgi:hypothetical protein
MWTGEALMEWWRWALIAADLVFAVLLFRWMGRSWRRDRKKAYARAVWEAEQREAREQRRGRS